MCAVTVHVSFYVQQPCLFRKTHAHTGRVGCGKVLALSGHKGNWEVLQACLFKEKYISFGFPPIRLGMEGINSLVICYLNLAILTSYNQDLQYLIVFALSV